MKISPVNLCLQTRVRFKTHISQPAFLLLDARNVMLEGVVTACVSSALNSIEDPCALIIILFQIIPDHLFIRIKNAYASFTLVILGKSIFLYMFLYRLPVKTQFAGNCSHT